MKRENVEVNFRLPNGAADALREIAKLAGVTVSSVVKVAMAREVLRMRHEDGRPQWISVIDQLPTDDDYDDSERVLVRYRYTDRPGRPWTIGESRIDETDSETNGGWLFGSCDYVEVSHWMRKDSLLERLP